MKFKYSNLFLYLTGLLIAFASFKGLFFIFMAILTAVIAMIYEAFQKNGMRIKPAFVIVHFILTSLVIYPTYFSLKMFLRIGLGVLKKESLNFEELRYLTSQSLLIGIIFVLSLIIFIVGLFNAKPEPRPSCEK